MSMREDSFCSHCDGKNTILDDVCCKCSWNNGAGRAATEEEVAEANAKLQSAIDKMKRVLS